VISSPSFIYQVQELIRRSSAYSLVALIYEFDRKNDNYISEYSPRTIPSSEAHELAAKKAARETGIVPECTVKARVVDRTMLSLYTLENVHHLPFDKDFHVSNGGPAVQLEFVYDDFKKMFIRIVCSLGDGPDAILDGVTVSRLAFHTMEILENQELKVDVKYWNNKPPPLVFGKRQQWNDIRETNIAYLFIFIAKIRLFLEWMRELLFKNFVKIDFDKHIVNNPYSLFHFYQNEKHKYSQAHYHAFCPGGNEGFKDFLRLVEKWKQSIESTGFFYLMNFSPEVACGLTKNIQDIRNRETRYKHAFIPAGPGPPPPVWGSYFNALLSRKIIINNYGIHNHTFSAKPFAFIWDWLELAAPLHVCGCITINETFLSCTRGLPASLERNNAMVEEFGPPAAVTTQNPFWFEQMGPWNPHT
jgi:hypothetical protein